MTEREKYSKAIGKRIRALREGQNISIKDFEGLEDSIDRHALSRIETGQVTPSVYTLFKICRALKVSQIQIFNGLEDKWEI